MIIKENLKRLLLADLCARLPYGVMILHEDMEGKKVITKLVGYNGEWFNYYIDNLCYHLKLHEFKPYLRPMSSMTKEEHKYFLKLAFPYDFVDALNAHHFDYRGLIEKGLALEAPKDMYKIY